MRRCVTGLVIMALLALAAADAAAQATGTPTYNAPYRAFTRSEFGVLLSFPDGGGIAPEGIYRMASGRFDIGFKVGFHDPEAAGADAIILAGVEARQRIITHNVDFPLDGALVLGVGGRFVSGGSDLIVPIGVSLGRRVNPQGSTVSIVPYVQPTLFVVAGDGSDVAFALGLGADFRFTPRFDGRLSAGLGDLEGVSLGFVWVH